MSYKKLLSYFLCSTVLSAIVAGCAACSSAPIPPPRPVIKLFEAKYNIIEEGKSTTISWAVEDADTVEISEIGFVEASGSKTLQPSKTTTYTLRASKEGMVTEMPISVTVTPPPPAPTVTLSASPTKIKAEEKAVLSWNAQNAEYVELREGNTLIGLFQPKGTYEVVGKTKGTLNYTITAFGRGGKGNANASIEVTDFTVGDKIAISINFPTGSAVIPRSELPKLDEVINLLKQKPNLVVEISGHTDNTGGGKPPVKGKKESDAAFEKRLKQFEERRKKQNQALSLRRAAAVRTYLIQQKIAARRMTVRGAGESEPVASNDTEEGRAQNRRIELRAIGTLQDIEKQRERAKQVRKQRGQ
ncbi:MAG: OmpA family protein [Chloroherpetonaceae bacterium]|nr:OmpA family protein [Chloroherpetonaceae bacterium]MCS7210837.1 OmpA family protein [Chloroherpetonaceae bacterium]MDW8020712.1 OmpA family protein [Chloroherpetonaceae bacterium]